MTRPLPIPDLADLQEATSLDDIAGLWADRNDLADPSAFFQSLRAPREFPDVETDLG